MILKVCKADIPEKYLYSIQKKELTTSYSSLEFHGIYQLRSDQTPHNIDLVTPSVEPKQISSRYLETVHNA